MNIGFQQIAVIAGVILVIFGGYYFYHQYKKSLKSIARSSSDTTNTGSDHSEKHPINQKHGTLKVWLSDTCPWCKKQVAVFKAEGIEYEEQDGAPPDGDGVPQTQSAKTGKVCGGFKEAKDLAECLQ